MSACIPELQYYQKHLEIGERMYYLASHLHKKQKSAIALTSLPSKLSAEKILQTFVTFPPTLNRLRHD